MIDFDVVNNKGQHRRAAFVLLCGLFCVFCINFLGGCSTLSQLLIPSEVKLSRAEIESALAKKFPIEQSFLQIVTAKINAPYLDFLPASNQLQTTFQLELEPVWGKSFLGSMTLKSGLKYDSSKYSILLNNPSVSDLNLPIPGFIEHGVRDWVIALVEMQLKNMAIYTLSADKIKKYGHLVEITNIDVVNQGLVIQLKAKEE